MEGFCKLRGVTMIFNLGELIFNKNIRLRCPACQRIQGNTVFRHMVFESTQIVQCEKCFITKELYCFTEYVAFCGDDDPFIKLVISNWGHITKNDQLEKGYHLRIDTIKRNCDTSEAIHFCGQVDNGCCPSVAKVLYDAVLHFKKESHMAFEFKADIGGVLKIYQGKDGFMFMKTKDDKGEPLGEGNELFFSNQHEFTPHLVKLVKAGLVDMQGHPISI